MVTNAYAIDDHDDRSISYHGCEPEPGSLPVPRIEHRVDGKVVAAWIRKGTFIREIRMRVGLNEIVRVYADKEIVLMRNPSRGPWVCTFEWIWAFVVA